MVVLVRSQLSSRGRILSDSAAVDRRVNDHLFFSQHTNRDGGGPKARERQKLSERCRVYTLGIDRSHRQE